MSLVVKGVYNLFILPVLFLLVHVACLFSKKIRLATLERHRIFKTLRVFKKTAGRRSVLIHASSMGEFEHIKPLIGKLKDTYPNSNVIVTFFSPSGYNNVKAFKGVDLFLYLPFDFSWTMRRFYNIVRPDALIIAKYDLWPNMIWQASQLQIPIFIINASLTRESNRFKGLSLYFHRQIYKHLSEVWVSSHDDVERFQKITKNVRISVTGDTKFDQVIWRRENAKRNQIIDETIVQQKRVFIAGSIWPEDWEVILPSFNRLLIEFPDLIVILVPHEPTESHIEDIEAKLEHPSIRFSRVEEYLNERFIIVNRIGVLASMYAKADFAYVGGSFKQNIHNVLEPAVFGIPVFYGPVHKNSFEAVELKNAGGSIVVESEDEFYAQFRDILTTQEYYNGYCNIAETYTTQNQGATDKVLYRIKQYIS